MLLEEARDGALQLAGAVAVNQPHGAVIPEQRGVETRLLTDAASGDFRNVTTLRGTLGDGSEVSVAGTLTGPRMIEKVVGINGFDLEVPLTDHLAVFTYADRPGVVGQVGQILGDEGINIGGMQVARSERQGSALVLLNVDVALPQVVAARIAEAFGAESFAVINL